MSSIEDEVCRKLLVWNGPSNNTKTVCERIAARAEVGMRKYGQGMDRIDFTKRQWLVHAQEEAMDLPIYLEKILQLGVETYFEGQLLLAQRMVALTAVRLESLIQEYDAQKLQSRVPRQLNQ